MSECYDLCVIGAGTAGYAAARVAQGRGTRFAVVTGPGDLGGTCILRGCMPAKTLLASTQRLGDVAESEGVGITAERVRADLPAMVARKRELVEYFSEDRVAELASFPLVRGCARFVDETTVDVSGRRIRAERFVIATGSHVVAPAIDGLADCGYLVSDDVLELTERPASIAIVGGGPVGCEFAQYFARLGSRVTLVQDHRHLLRNEDADVGEAVAAALRDDGVDVVLGTRIAACRRDGERRRLRFATGDGSPGREITVDAIFLSTGRVANVAGLDLRAGGMLDADGSFPIDATLRTRNPRVFVAGDALGRRCLVHVAEYTGRLAATNALDAAAVAADFDRYEAHAVYTQPQVAVAGLTEVQCRERGVRIRVARHAFEEVGKAIVDARPEGFVKMIADEGGRIRGVAIVGDDAVDIIGEAIASIDRGASVADVAEMPHLHPTLGEILGRVAEDLTAQYALVER